MENRVLISGFHGQSVQFSPYLPNRLACAAGQNYGIAGSGKVFVVDLILGPSGAVQDQCLCTFDWQDTFFDASWSERSEQLLATCSGDGSVHVWNVNNNKGPVSVKREHSKEVYSIDWGGTRDNQYIVTGSWDHSIKLWDPTQPSSLCTMLGHEGVVYSTRWSPHIPHCIASTSGDKTLCLWDTRKPAQQQAVSAAHGGEVLSCDWSKYDQNVIISGSVDCCIYAWDIRNLRTFVYNLAGHQSAVRRVKCSPFTSSVIASCSYDLTTRIWDPSKQLMPLQVLENHTEMVCGIDFNIHIPGQIADCSWDQSVHVYRPPCLTYLS